MDFNEYQVKAQRTARRDLDFQTRLMVAALGLAGEAGEVADIIKKHIGHGHPLDLDELVKEMGDELWYIQELCELIQVPMSSVAQKNITKLEKRYAKGFSVEESLHREEANE